MSENLSVKLLKIKETIDKYKGAAHILTPIPRKGDLSEISLPQYTDIATRTVWISSDKKDGEVYSLSEKPNELILTKIALQRLGSAAGIHWSDLEVLVNDDEPLVAAARIVGTVIDLDGSKRSTIGRASLDLRDNSAQAKNKRPGQLAVARANILSLVETGAKNKIRRELLQLMNSYKAEDLEKPFILFTLIPDQAAVLKDFPVFKQTLAAQSIGIAHILFGDSQQQSIASPPPRALLEAANEDVASRIVKSSIAEIVDEEPETKQEPPPLSPHKTAEIAAEVRACRISDISELYTKKVRGGRAPNKPPLSELSDSDLESLEKMLLERPDIT